MRTRAPSRPVIPWAALAAVLLAGACRLGPAAAPPAERPLAELPLVLIEPGTELVLRSLEPGLATRLGVELTLTAFDRPFTLVGRRPTAEVGDDSLVDLRVRVVDFPGTAPQSQGRTLPRDLAFGPDGLADPDQPLVRGFEFDLDPPAGGRPMLARRVELTARLYAVDLVAADGHTGTQVLAFPPVVLDTLARPPGLGLDEALARGEAETIFLAAAATSAVERWQTLGRLIDALSGQDGAALEAVFASLLFLTGETHGRSEYRWRAWWSLQNAP